MSDDYKSRGAVDRSRINVNHPWQVSYWCKKLGCSETQLRQAVDAAGPTADQVRKYLGAGSSRDQTWRGEG